MGGEEGVWNYDVVYLLVTGYMDSLPWRPFYL